MHGKRGAARRGPSQNGRWGPNRPMTDRYGSAWQGGTRENDAANHHEPMLKNTCRPENWQRARAPPTRARRGKGGNSTIECSGAGPYISTKQCVLARVRLSRTSHMNASPSTIVRHGASPPRDPHGCHPRRQGIGGPLARDWFHAAGRPGPGSERPPL